jgi:hypothetical protein
VGLKEKKVMEARVREMLVSVYRKMERWERLPGPETD